MAGSLIDMFPPEAQTLFGIASAVTAVAGLFVWGAGIKIARFGMAALLGFSAAGIAAWMLPGVTGMAALTAALIGFAVGVLAGAVSFRFVQGALFAVCLTAAVIGGYYQWQVGKPAASASATMPAGDMMIPVPRLPESPEAALAGNAPAHWDAARLAAVARTWCTTVEDWTVRHWQAMPAVHQHRIAALAVLTALLGLVVAIRFPRPVTWVLSAAAGTLMLSTASVMLLQVFAPQYEAMVPRRASVVVAALGALMLGGMLLQRVVFWPKKKKARAVAAPAVPVAGT